jgi:hypothetical protein
MVELEALSSNPNTAQNNNDKTKQKTMMELDPRTIRNILKF